jgi:Spy/CpxP family protein refolding chaperone
MAYGRISWTNPKVLTTLLLVFFCGAASGALALKTITRRMAPKASVTLRVENKKDVLARFERDLDLSRKQVEKIEIILDDFMKYVHDLQVQMDETRSYGKDQILKVLTEEQRKKFERTLAEAQTRTSFR